MRFYYSTYADYMLILDMYNSEFEIRYEKKTVANKLRLEKDSTKIMFHETENIPLMESNNLAVRYKDGDKTNEVLFVVGNNGVRIETSEPLMLKGLPIGDGIKYAMSTGEYDFFRCAYGNACTPLDNMLFDVKTDSGIVINGPKGKKFRYNRDVESFEICTLINGSAEVSFEERVYEQKYKINYAPINKKTTFPKPPVGWMTWYAVKFDACEKAVLDNTKWMAENLKKYGAETVWVDWEWYHKDMKGIRDDGCDTFHPDKEKYPNGLKFVADKIKEYGFIPSLWIGFTNDPGQNEYIKQNPEIVLAEEKCWCGHWFFDLSHPKYLNEFLPKALSQVFDWGYEAVKYDTIPNCLRFHEKNHSAMYNPNLTTKEAYRNMIARTRDFLGKDMYMLECAGCFEAEILWACDMFDAARIGDDVFKWEEFIDQAIARAARYYPMHNLVFYNDPDNVVIREEFNTFEQAKTRAAFVSMLGLPFTMGDNLPHLPEERVEILRRTIPTMDIHPMSVNRFVPGEVVVTNLNVDMSYENYNVVSIMNTSESKKAYTADFDNLGIEGEEFTAYEFYSDDFCVIKDGKLKAELKPFETKVYAVRKTDVIPKIVSTSRHIYQGALEIEDIKWDEDTKALSFVSEIVEGDNYIVSIYAPEGYTVKEQNGFDRVSVDGKLIKLSVKSDKNAKTEFSVAFN